MADTGDKPKEAEKKPAAKASEKKKPDESASSDDESSSSERRKAKKGEGRRKEKSAAKLSSGGSPALFLKKDDKSESDDKKEKTKSLRLKNAQEKSEDEELEAMRLNIAFAKKTDIKIPLPVFEAYQKIAEFASRYCAVALPKRSPRFLPFRRLNTSWEEAEVVFIGPRGSGKTTLIESILGHPGASSLSVSPPPIFVFT